MPDYDSRHATSSLSLATEWEVLGPFQIGTREAPWGADPLEYIGGFRSLRYDANEEFASSLGVNGTVTWKKLCSSDSLKTLEAESVRVVVDFPEIRWGSLQSVYGWAALQYQAWIRANLILYDQGLRFVSLSLANVLEYWIDDQQIFGGDFYSFGKAPIILPLSPGEHRLDIRVIRDVRAMGGTGDPNVPIEIKASLSSNELLVDHSNVLLPEFVEGRSFSSNIGSIPVQNFGESWIDVLAVEVASQSMDLSLLDPEICSLAPGQPKSLAVSVRSLIGTPRSVDFHITYKKRNSSADHRTRVFSVPVTTRRIEEPHRVTFLHPSHAVSYAILRPPMMATYSSDRRNETLPVLLNLHGAGLEADDDQVKHMLDSVDDLDAWIIFPTGGTPWSADDWHTWGFADVEGALSAIPSWIETLSWTGPAASLNSLYVVGHSNGGQGAWFALTHLSDKIEGAAPVSGYSSIQSYVPYVFWHEADPRIASIIETALSGFRHELLMENVKGVPILQQHGSLDENVPVYHSRRLYQLLEETGSSPRYVELPGKGHWYEGVMETQPLRNFYRNISRHNDTQKMFPKSFSIVIPASGFMLGTRGGILVDQLVSPDIQGRIQVQRQDDDKVWVLRTLNIQRFHFSRNDFKDPLPASILIDGNTFDVHMPNSETIMWYYRPENRAWKASSDVTWRSIRQRYGFQLGTMDAILRSKGNVSIQYAPQSVLPVAVQSVRNLYQYFSANCDIIEVGGVGGAGNLITIIKGMPESGSCWMPGKWENHPIRICHEGIRLRDSSARENMIAFEPGMGAIYLGPLPEERLELLVWGLDSAGLRRASRLIPSLTGVGQPDFAILRKECSWRGAAGALAMGFFDFEWNISRSSYLA